VRWVRSTAGTYAVDTTRIGFAGNSAGGAIALGVGMGNDLTPGGPLAAHSPTVATAVSTGAHLTPGLSLPVWTPDRTPVLMYTHEIESTEPDAPRDHDYETCLFIRDGGGQCDWHEIPGEGHTISISPHGSRWAGITGPYLWDTLRLGSL
jgi:enterochelin esterase-like enzyme